MVNIFLVSHHFMFHGKSKNTYHGLLTQKLLASYEQVLNEINEPSSSELVFWHMAKYLLWNIISRNVTHLNILVHDVKLIVLLNYNKIKSIIIIINFIGFHLFFKVLLIRRLPKIFFNFLKPIEFVSYYNYKNYHFVSCNINIWLFFIEEAEGICQVIDMILLMQPKVGDGKSHR